MTWDFRPPEPRDINAYCFKPPVDDEAPGFLQLDVPLGLRCGRQGVSRSNRCHSGLRLYTWADLLRVHHFLPGTWKRWHGSDHKGEDSHPRGWQRTHSGRNQGRRTAPCSSAFLGLRRETETSLFSTALNLGALSYHDWATPMVEPSWNHPAPELLLKKET